MKKAILSILLFGSFFSLLIAQNEELNSKIEEIREAHELAFFTYSKEDYLKIWNDCERIIAMAPESNAAKYHAAHAAYRLMNTGLISGDKSVITNYMKAGIKYADELENDPVYTVEAAIIKANILMMKIAMVPEEAPAISGQIHSLLGKALAMDEGNPRALLTKGIMLFNTPEQYGGSVKQAVGLLEAGLKNFETAEQKNVFWGKPETMAWLGQAYAKLGNNGKARETYEEALKLYPDFGWVRYRLLPALDQK